MHTTDPISSSRTALWAFRLLCLGAFGVTFSIAAGQIFCGLAVITWGIGLLRRELRVQLSAIAVITTIYAVLAIVSAALGTNPERGLDKADSLFWLLLLLVTSSLVRTPRRFRQLLGAVLAGTCVLALQVIVLNPIQARANMAAGLEWAHSFEAALIDVGGMTDGQMLMVGIVLCCGFLALPQQTRKQRLRFVLMLVLLCVGLEMNFKRGSWICTLAVGGLFILRMDRRLILVALIALPLAACVPLVRERAVQIQDEFDVSGGGRITMWFEVTPRMLEEHPWGIGFASMTEEKMQSYSDTVERHRNHLHSNIAQILATMGWLGLAVYTLWMGCGVRDAARRLRAVPPAWRDSHPLALAVLLALVGLILNGLIEYNIGDSEVLILYAILLGIPVALRVPVAEA